MKVKVFDKNENGKIEFTRKELEALLNEVYDEGYRDSESKHWVVSYGTETTKHIPDITTLPYTTSTSYPTPNVVYCSAEASNAVGDSVCYGNAVDDELPGQLSFFD